jgi:hypothetical protein
MSSGSIQSFVHELLRTSPGAPHSVQLEMDTGDVHGMFEALLIIMTEILKSWYPPPISIGSISGENLVRLIAYYASFGIQFSLSEEEIPRVLRINNKTYLQESRLEAMKFQMSHGSKLYTVRFLPLLPETHNLAD